MFLKALFTGFAVATLALAQGGMGGGGGADGSGGMGGGGNGVGTIGSTGKETGGVPAGGTGGRVQKESKADQIVNRLKLNKDQKSEFETIMESTAKEAAPVIQQVLQCRNAIATALINGKTDADMAPLSKALSEAQFQMTGVEVKAFQRIVALLKPNQTAKAPEAFDLMSDIFLPQIGGAGGGMGRRGGR